MYDEDNKPAVDLSWLKAVIGDQSLAIERLARQNGELIARIEQLQLQADEDRRLAQGRATAEVIKTELEPK